MSHLVAKYGSHLCAPQKSKIRSVHFYILKKLPPALPQAGDESLCDFASLVSEIRPNISRWRRCAGRKDLATNGPLCPPAEDHINSQTCWRSIRSDARLLSTARHHLRNCPAARRIPTSPAWRKSLETTNALSR